MKLFAPLLALLGKNNGDLRILYFGMKRVGLRTDIKEKHAL